MPSPDDATVDKKGVPLAPTSAPSSSSSKSGGAEMVNSLSSSSSSASSSSPPSSPPPSISSPQEAPTSLKSTSICSDCKEQQLPPSASDEDAGRDRKRIRTSSFSRIPPPPNASLTPKPITLTDEERMEKMRGACMTILQCIGEDPEREGLISTPKRWAKVS